MVLLEREHYLVELDKRLAAAAAGRGGVVLIGGEAGIGKSALVGQWVSQIDGRARVLAGACDALSTPRPLGPLFDFAETAGGVLAEQVRTGANRDLLFASCLVDLTRSTAIPTVVLIEDAHWADGATLDLIRYLGRRLGTSRSLLVLTYRDDEVGAHHPLRIVLGDLASTARPLRLSLLPLSLDAMRLLANGAPVDPVGLHQQTGGNPFFATEVLASPHMTVPPTVADAVLARSARLPDSAKRALDAAAVLGSIIDPDELAAVSAVGHEAIESCVAGGMLRIDDGRLAFRHELARRAILRAIVPSRLTDLHRQALRILRTVPEGSLNPTRLAHHAEGAGDAEAVLEFATAAARLATSVGAHREAAAQYERALRFSSETSGAEHTQLLRDFAGACKATGRLNDAIQARRRLIEWARRAGNAEEEAEHLALSAVMLVSDGRNQESEDEIDAALSLLDLDHEGPGHTVPYYVHAQIRMLNRDNTAAIEWGTRAIRLAERFGNVDTLINATNAVGSAKMFSGDEEGGLADLERSRQMAAEAGMDVLVANAYTNLGSCCGELYRLELAEHYLTEGIGFATARDFDSLTGYMRSWLALIRMYQGRWDEAAAEADAVLRFTHPIAVSRIMALVALGRVRARRNDPDVAAALDEALSLAEPTATVQRIAPVRAARAEAAWMAGDIERTIAEASAAYDLALKHAHPWHAGELSYWLWKAGALDAPDAVAASPWAKQMRGDAEGAADEWFALGCPYESFRALAECGDVESLRRALEGFDRLGAARDVAMVTRQLRGMGHGRASRGPRSSTRAHPAGLTQREQEILRLIAEGDSNSEIASKLFVSPKTVEHHVSSILTKLGVSRRSHAVSAERRLVADLKLKGEASPI